RALRRADQARRAQAVQQGAERALAALEVSVRRAAEAREEAESARVERDAALVLVRAEADRAAAELAALTEVAHRDAAARAQQELRVTQLHERAVTDLGLDPQTLIAEFGPDRPVPVRSEDGSEESVPYVRAEQEKRLRAAERALSLLGRVNPLALEEYAAL